MGIKKILGWSSMIVMFSCEKNITVKAPPQSAKLVVNSMTGINMPFTALVGKTAGILDLTTPESYVLSNAVVVLYENNLAKDTLLFDSTIQRYHVKHNTIARAGFRYQLKASAAEFNTAEAETEMPEAVSIHSLTRHVNARTDADGNMYDEVIVRFTDNASTSNYYIIKFRRPYEHRGNIQWTGMNCMRSLDTEIDRKTDIDQVLFDDCIDKEVMVTDKQFNGRMKELTVFIRHEELEPVVNPADKKQYKAVVELNNITGDHYRQCKSYKAYRESEDNPFAEPVLVYSNIKNGYGLFSTYNLAVDTIR